MTKLILLEKFYQHWTQKEYSLKSILSGILLMILLFLLLSTFQFDPKAILIVIGIPIITILFLSYNTYIYFLILSLFSNYIFFGLYISVYISLGLLLAFLISYRNFSAEIFKTPLTVPIVIYYISIIPSLFNSSDLFLSSFLMFNLHAIVILVFVFSYTLRDYKIINSLIITFVSLVVVDSVVIIFLALSEGGRLFGLSGVVFVDYAAMSVVPLLLYVVFSKKYYSKFYIFIILLVMSGLIFSQTRNTFISLALTAITLIIFLFFKSDKFNISRRKLMGTFITAIIFTFTLIIIMTITNPEVFGRFEELGKSSTLNVKTEADFYRNSLLSRILIWDTALNAFKEHPIIGIGAFSFPFESVKYYTISKELFDEFVEGLSPHVTFIAILTETGILGFIGFIILLTSSLRISLKSNKKANSEDQKFYSLIILSLQIYIFFSMFLSDAWLWGQCGMLWGIVLGISIANYRIIINRKSVLND